jgi:hypothetical protein
MKALVYPRIHLASLVLVAAWLIVAPPRQARAQANSAVAPSSSGATVNAPSGDDRGEPADNGNAATHHKAAHSQAQHKKKKTSFMNKMRDKWMDKVQKLFGRKQESQPAAKQIPQRDIE